MLFRLPTASALERAIACPSSLVLPQIFAGSSEDAERGTAIGRYARDVLASDGSFEESLARVPRSAWRATCAALDFEAICGDLSDVRAEVAYGVHPESETARELGLNLGRRYPTPLEGEFVGTNDLEGRCAGREVVCDLKSGREVTACAVNPQMMFHALARWLVTGAPEVEARVLYVREDGRVFRDAHVFTAFELQRFADVLVELVGRIEAARASAAAGDTLAVYSGTHCRYCPALQGCPAYTALARTMVDDLADITGRIAAMTPEESGQAWTKAKRIEKLLEVVLDSLKARARQTPLPTRIGKVVREITFEKREFSQAAALELLREKATQVEIDTCYVTAVESQVRELNEVPSKRRKRAA